MLELIRCKRGESNREDNYGISENEWIDFMAIFYFWLYYVLIDHASV